MEENEEVKEVKFEDLSSEEQVKKLKSILNDINNMNKARILQDGYYIVDIAFNRTENGEIVYDVTFNDPNSKDGVSHEFYKDAQDSIYPVKIDILDDEKLKQYEALGSDTTQIKKDQEEIKKLPESEKKISLVELERQRKELEKTAEKAGINKEEIEDMTKIEGNKFTIDESKLEQGSIASEKIKGDDKITTYQSLNDVLGMNYASYKIIKNMNGTSFIAGIREDGTVDIIDNSKIEIINNKQMSLMRTDGSIKEVGVSVAFKVRNAGSSINRDQAIGLYNDNGRYGAFYARGASQDKERMLGEEIPSESYTRKTVKEKEILDRRENQDIADEAKSAEKRTDDGCLDKTENIAPENEANQRDELIEKYATAYGLDKEELEQNVDENLEDEHDKNKEDEEVIEDTAEEMKDEDEKEKTEEEKEQEEEDAEFEKTHGTPWGNPNLHN